MKVIMFGAGATGRALYGEVSQKNEVVAFIDNDASKWGKRLFDIPIFQPEECLLKTEYDAIIISAFCGLEEIFQQCLKLGILFLNKNIGNLVVTKESGYFIRAVL